jgi:xanthosine utilization system XapX-like protein
MGVATSWGQLLLPSGLTSIANSAGGWSLVVFALVRWSRARPPWAATLGLLCFYALHIGYALASSARGYSWSLAPTNFWVAAGIVAGPLVGVGAAWVRCRTDVLAAVGVAGLSGLLIGEGIYGLTVISATTSPIYWSASIAMGVAFAAWMAWRRLRRPLTVAVTLTLTACTSAALLVAYSLAG